MNAPSPGVASNRLRYARRFSSVDSTPIDLNRLAIVGALSSTARMPLPAWTSESTVACNCSRVLIVHSSMRVAWPSPGSEPARCRYQGGYIGSRDGVPEACYFVLPDEYAVKPNVL